MTGISSHRPNLCSSSRCGNWPLEAADRQQHNVRITAGRAICPDEPPGIGTLGIKTSLAVLSCPGSKFASPWLNIPF
ncbi:hypothetical protein VTN96DRAFT_8020 [Rasamsonia emersonii]